MRYRRSGRSRRSFRGRRGGRRAAPRRGGARRIRIGYRL